MQIAINPTLYSSAQIYAEKKGLDLTAVVEKFLERFVDSSKETDSEQVVPDVVLSLLGAGAPVAKDDINGREAYNQYLEEKYK